MIQYLNRQKMIRWFVAPPIEPWLGAGTIRLNVGGESFRQESICININWIVAVTMSPAERASIPQIPSNSAGAPSPDQVVRFRFKPPLPMQRG